MIIEKVNVNKLSGLALDYAVAKCIYSENSWDKEDHIAIARLWKYSSDWGNAGFFIIARKGISIINVGLNTWKGCISPDVEVIAETPLLAAMRCYVASELGSWVDIPSELLY